MRLIRPISINLIRCFLSILFSCTLPAMAQRINQVPDPTQSINAVPAILRYTDTVNSANRVNSNTCNTSTFRLRLTAGPGRKIDVQELLTLADGNFFVAGNTYADPASPGGLICILNNAGAIQVQKEILINNKPTRIGAAKANYAGDIFISGEVREDAGKIFVASLNAGLLPEWVTVLDIGQVPQKVVMTYINDTSIVVAAQLNTEIKYALLNGAGTVQWTRQYSPVGMNTLVGLGHNENSQVSLVVNCTRAARQVTDVISFSQVTGAPFMNYTVGSPADEYRFGKVTSFSNRFTMNGVVRNNAGQFRFIRQTQYNAASSDFTNTYEIPLPVGFNFSSALDVAADAPAFCLPQDGKLIFVRHFSTSNTGPEYTRGYDVGTGSSIAGVSRSLTDGGYLFGLNTQAQDSILLIKTDSIGILAGCSYTSIANIHTETLGVQNTVSGNGGAYATAPVTTGVWQQQNIAVSLITDCNQTYCPPAPPADTCLSTFYKTFRGNSYTEFIRSYWLMRNNTHLMVSSKYDRILGNNNRQTYNLKLLSERGDLIKGKTIFTNGASLSAVMRKVDDQHAMLVHYSSRNGTPINTLTLINDSLNILWSTSFETFPGLLFPFENAPAVSKDTEGNYYYVTCTPGFGENVKLMALKLDPNGNQLWMKVYQMPIQVFAGTSVTTTPAGVIIIMEGYTAGSVSVRLDKLNGNFLNAWNYQNHSAGYGYGRYLNYENGYIWYCGNRKESFDENVILMLFDETGYPMKMKKLNSNSSLPRAFSSKNGKLSVCISYYDGVTDKEGLLQTDTSFVPAFYNTYNYTRYGYSRGMGIADNGALFMAGTYYHGGETGNYSDPFIRKTDSAGVTGICTYEQPGMSFTTIPLTPVAITATLLNQGFIPATVPINLIPDTSTFRVAEVLCSSTPLCTTVQVSGPQAVCQLNQPFTYNSIRNPGCDLSPVWVYDTAFAVLQSSNSNSGIFTFRRTGITRIYAKINTGCNLYTDSIDVNIQASPAVFSLGADTVICAGDSLLLNAGTGFSSYQWQDGSTDSVFVVHGPGTYYVQTTNLCGNVYNDTINVIDAIVPPLNIGADVNACINDTLRFMAQPGFVTYNWFPAVQVSGNGQQAYVIPTGTMNVWVNVVTSDGCKKSDTLTITGISAPPVYLGRDTSFCLKDSIVLNAGAGYQQYNWSTGATGSSVTVKQAGTYWIKATAANGCTAKDTMRVIQIYPLPQPALGNDFSLCTGIQQRLDPGAYSSYLWQNGSTASFLNVSLPGTYHVLVTDANQCRAADTVVLLQVLPSPSGFLAGSDSICSFSSIELSPLQSFASYQWNTGERQKIISITTPGNYILTVVNSDGCSGKDTISVYQKNCFTGVFVPSAFTPNNDGRNDLFKPMLFGSVISLMFEVYDRSGQLVYRTSNPSSGWNGTVQGVQQSSGLYVWQCRYQLAGEEPGYKKGTVMLIR